MWKAKCVKIYPDSLNISHSWANIFVALYYGNMRVLSTGLMGVSNWRHWRVGKNEVRCTVPEMLLAVAQNWFKTMQTPPFMVIDDESHYSTWYTSQYITMKIIGSFWRRRNQGKICILRGTGEVRLRENSARVSFLAKEWSSCCLTHTGQKNTVYRTWHLKWLDTKCCRTVIVQLEE